MSTWDSIRVFEGAVVHETPLYLSLWLLKKWMPKCATDDRLIRQLHLARPLPGFGSQMRRSAGFVWALEERAHDLQQVLHGPPCFFILPNSAVLQYVGRKGTAPRPRPRGEAVCYYMQGTFQCRGPEPKEYFLLLLGPCFLLSLCRSRPPAREAVLLTADRSVVKTCSCHKARCFCARG